MHLIRRAAFRAASSPSNSFISKRPITTSPPFLLRSKVQSSIAPSVFRRFASDEANSEERSSVESADGEDQGSVRSAIDSATETASSYAGEAAESLSRNAAEARDAVADTAAGVAAAASQAFTPRGRSEPREYNNRDSGSYPSRGSRAGYSSGYNNGRGSDRGGYGGERRPDRYEPRQPMDRVLVPTPGIYIGNLLFDVTSSDLEKEFESFGKIKSAIIASDARGLSKGFGYIEFETTEQATAAIEAKHQTVLEGRRLIVNYMAKTTRESKPNPPSKTLFIGNLAFEMSDADLNRLFRDIRNVIDVRVAIDRRTGQPRGFAHADFVDVESAKNALDALMGKEIYGRKLRVDFSAGARETRGDGSGGPPSGGRDRDSDRF